MISLFKLLVIRFSLVIALVVSLSTYDIDAKLAVCDCNYERLIASFDKVPFARFVIFLLFRFKLSVANAIWLIGTVFL